MNGFLGGTVTSGFLSPIPRKPAESWVGNRKSTEKKVSGRCWRGCVRNHSRLFEIDLFPDDDKRLLAYLGVNRADILADNPQKEHLDPGKEQDEEDHRG